jgi:hypothetical protein
MATPATALTGIVDESLFVKALQKDAYGGVSNTAVVWTTSSASVATVSKQYNSNDAVINCVTAGTATITATMGSASATFALTVYAAAANDGYFLTVESDKAFQPVNRTMQTRTLPKI